MELQYALCRNVLKRLDDASVLQDLIIVGSWCLYFYRDYFAGTGYGPLIRTRDIDFLVPARSRLKHTADVPRLMQELGFVADFHRQGYMRLVHPELIIEFLIPERGRGVEGPVRLPQLGMNAQALRFLNLLAEHTVTIRTGGITVRLPHPAAFALHKLLIAPRRVGKQAKERAEARTVLEALIAKGEQRAVRKVYDSLPSRWQQQIVEAFKAFPEFRQIVLPNR